MVGDRTSTVNVLVVRHAATPDNEAGFIPDHGGGPPLSSAGRRDAEALAQPVRHLVSSVGAAVLSSPSRRAIETALLITGRTPVIEESLRELDIGMPGTRNRESIRLLSARMREWQLGRHLGESAFGGETAKDVWARLGILEAKLLSGREGNVIAITHFAVMRLWAQSMGLFPPDDHVPGLLDACWIELNVGVRRAEWVGSLHSHALEEGCAAFRDEFSS